MTDNKLSQFMSIIGYGRAPSNGAPDWACVTGITREGARVPGACNHVRLRAEPVILYGTSPIEAGQLATIRADQAYDHGKRLRRIRPNGWALLAGVISYPVPRKDVESDPAQKRRYLIWQKLVLRFLKRTFRDHLKSGVEHSDEKFLHLHFYVVPELRADRRLNTRDIHPGLIMKRDAEEAGASKKVQDAAYRSGMSRWQDDYWWAVSRHLGHTRFGPARRRVSRRQRLMERQMEEEAARQQAERDAERDKFEREMARRRADLDQVVAAVRAKYEQANQMLRDGCVTLKGRAANERARRQAAEAEIERLRARVAELEQEEEASARFAA